MSNKVSGENMSQKAIKIIISLMVVLLIALAAVLLIPKLRQQNKTEDTTNDNNISFEEFYNALISGNKDVYAQYIDSGSDLSFAFTDGTEKGRTPLEILIMHNDIEYALKVIDNGFDLKIVENNHIDTISSIIFSVTGIKHDVINDITLTLIEQVEDELTIADKDGYSLLMNALISGNNDIALKIIEKLSNEAIDLIYNNETALSYACMINSDLEIIEALVEKGADINYKGNDGNTSLLYLVMNEFDEEKLAYLIDIPNINLNVVNQYEHSVLHIAVEYNNVEALDYLLNNTKINFDSNLYESAKEYALELQNEYPDDETIAEIVNLFN